MGGIRKMAATGWPTSKSCPNASVLTATAETAVSHPRSFGGFTVGDRVAFRQTGQREWFLEHITILEDGKLPRSPRCGGSRTGASDATPTSMTLLSYSRHRNGLAEWITTSTSFP
jgi:hypothetical protein